MTSVEAAKYEEFLAEAGEPRLAQLAYFRWKCQTDLWWLATEVYGWDKIKRARPLWAGGKKLPLLDKVFHRWLAGVMGRPGDKLLEVPRGHLKSAFAMLYIVQRILARPDIRVLLVSATAELVESEVGELKQLITHPLLLEAFPDVIQTPGKGFKNLGTANTLVLKRPEGSQAKVAHVEAYGIHSRFTGKHFDLHVYDDLHDKENSSSMDQIKKVRDSYGFFQAILDPAGDELMIGTPYHYADLFSQVKQEGIYDRIYRRPAIENGQPIYSYYSLKMLERLRKRMGEYMFSCQFMCDVLPREDIIFPPPHPTYVALPQGEYTISGSLLALPVTREPPPPTPAVVPAVPYSSECLGTAGDPADTGPVQLARS